jgi:hypothetical protein
MPFSEKEHFVWLSGALKGATPSADKHGEDDNADHGDIEDEENVESSGRKTKGKGRKKHRSRQECPSPANTSNKIDTMHPTTPPLTRPATPSGTRPQDLDSPHRYPPAGNSVGNHGIDTEVDGDTTLVHSAAKALKTAVLHDARNIQGKGNEGEAVLPWNVESAHEAKVLTKFPPVS